MKDKIWEKEVERLSDLNITAKGKMILVKKLERGLLAKAEVIGVKGIICLEDESDDESSLLIKKVSRDEWNKLR